MRSPGGADGCLAVLSHGLFSVLTWSERGLWHLSSSYKDTSPIGLGPHRFVHLSVITFLKALSPNTDTLGIRALLYELGVGWRYTIQSITETKDIRRYSAQGNLVECSPYLKSLFLSYVMD